MPEPSRGEIWLVNLSPTRGHEQAGKRPGLVVSVDLFNHFLASLFITLP
jgi:mRNA interferase MazF